MNGLEEFICTSLQEYSEGKRRERFMQEAPHRAAADARSIAAFYKRRDAESEALFRAYEGELKKQNVQLESIKAALAEAEAEQEKASENPDEIAFTKEGDPMSSLLLDLDEFFKLKRNGIV